MILSPEDMATLRACAAQADATGLLQPRQLALIHRRGWLRMLAPRDCGGAELPLPQVVRLEEDLARAEGSVGWMVTLCAGAGWFAGFLPPALAREVIGTRRVCVAGSGAAAGTASRVAGGWRITGRWPHASGAPWATHFTLNARIEGDQARTRAFIVEASQVRIEPTWHTQGLRATASHAYAIDRAWVPDGHAFDIAPGAAVASGPLYRFPFRALAFATLAANVSGMARHFFELAQRDHRVDEFDAARARVYELLDAAWAVDGAGAEALEAASLAWVKTAREAVDSLYPRCGLAAADTRTAINRVWRDFHTATQHALLVA